MSKEKELTAKQRMFVDYYLQSFNASDAARKAGYSEKTAREQGYDLIRLPHISSQIQTRLDEVHMGANEALKLQSDIARGDAGEFYDSNLVLDFESARKRGLTKLIKKIKQKTTTFIAKKPSEEDREVTEIELELYPADAAQERILRIHGKLVQRIEGGGENGAIKVEIGIKQIDYRTGITETTDGSDGDSGAPG